MRNLLPLVLFSISCTTQGEALVERTPTGEFVFNIPENFDSNVTVACLDWGISQLECGSSPYHSIERCEAFGRRDRPSAATFFACQAARSCGDHSTCPPPDGPTTMGEELCAAQEARCGFCDSSLEYDFREDARFWRDEVNDAARECFSQPTCGDLVACLDAWQEAFDAL